MNATPILRLTEGMTVRVKSFAEIAPTLDDNGTLDNLPFMPEMLPFCGKVFVITAKMDATCVEGVGPGQFQNDDVVILDGLRCDGSSHDGCTAGCAFFWKEAWLTTNLEDPNDASQEISPNLRTKKPDGKPFCQATELHKATHKIAPLPLLAKMLKQVVLGRTTFSRVMHDFSKEMKSRVLRKRHHHPQKPSIQTPLVVLGLVPGDMVRVKTEAEIRTTLDQHDRNRGLRFTPPMVPYCGGVHRVRSRLEKVIVESKGEMAKIPNAVVLEGVVCKGLVKCVECPRAQHLWWREAWLEKIESPSD